MTKALKTAALVAALGSLALPAVAQDINFELINNSQRAVIEFYASPTYDDYWGYDILGASILPPGRSANVLIADGERACVYDMMFVMEGNIEITGQTDICRSARYVLQ